MFHSQHCEQAVAERPHWQASGTNLHQWRTGCKGLSFRLAGLFGFHRRVEYIVADHRLLQCFVIADHVR